MNANLWVVVISYYSMFYLANALLYKIGYKVGYELASSEALMLCPKLKPHSLDFKNAL